MAQGAPESAVSDEGASRLPARTVGELGRTDLPGSTTQVAGGLM